MEDQPAESGDLTTGSAAEPGRRRRWSLLRRRSAKPEAAEPVAAESDAADGADPEPPEDKPASRVPVGKSRRTTKADEGEDTHEDEETRSEESEPESQSSEESEESEDSVADEPDPETVLVPYRPAGKRLRVAALVAAGLFVVTGAFAGATVQPYLSDRALVQNKLDVARTATSAITTLWTYTPDDMESLPDRSRKFLTGDFANEYRKYIDAIVATNKQAKVSNNTTVMGAAVESINQSEATALVYTNSVATSPVSKNIPSLRYLSYRLDMVRRNADWLITKMTAVTKLDLTPKL